MSSEESTSENEEILIVKPLPWRSEKVWQFFKQLDEKVERAKKAQAKRQRKQRVVSNDFSVRPKPITTLPVWSLASDPHWCLLVTVAFILAYVITFFGTLYVILIILHWTFPICMCHLSLYASLCMHLSLYASLLYASSCYHCTCDLTFMWVTWLYAIPSFIHVYVHVCVMYIFIFDYSTIMQSVIIINLCTLN